MAKKGLLILNLPYLPANLWEGSLNHGEMVTMVAIALKLQVNQGINKWKSVRNLRSIAEERVGRKCGSLRVLNSYWVAADPLFFFKRGLVVLWLRETWDKCYQLGDSILLVYGLFLRANMVKMNKQPTHQLFWVCLFCNWSSICWSKQAAGCNAQVVRSGDGGSLPQRHPQRSTHQLEPWIWLEVVEFIGPRPRKAASKTRAS